MICFFTFGCWFFFPDSLLGISRRLYSQMGTVSFRKSTISYWCWKSKWSRRYHSKGGAAIASSHTICKTYLGKLSVKEYADHCRNFRNQTCSIVSLLPQWQWRFENLLGTFRPSLGDLLLFQCHEFAFYQTHGSVKSWYWKVDCWLNKLLNECCVLLKEKKKVIYCHYHLNSEYQ